MHELVRIKESWVMVFLGIFLLIYIFGKWCEYIVFFSHVVNNFSLMVISLGLLGSLMVYLTIIFRGP